MAKRESKVLPTIAPVDESKSNQPNELDVTLKHVQNTLTRAVTGKRNYERGFAYTLADVWTLHTLGHFDDFKIIGEANKGKPFSEMVIQMATSAGLKKSVLQFMIVKLGLAKAMSGVKLDLEEPEKLSKKGTPEEEWKKYQQIKKDWQKTFNPLANILSRVIVVVGYLADSNRKSKVGKIETGDFKGCLYLHGSIYGDEKAHMPHQIVPYDKACSTLEEKAKNQFGMKRKQAQGGDAGVSLKRASEIMVQAITKEPDSHRTQTVLIPAMEAVKNGIEASQVEWNSTTPAYRNAVRSLLYTLLSEQHGIVALDVARTAMEQADKWEPPKDSEQKNIQDKVDDSGKVPMKEGVTV